ncbi:hypothetical protein DENIS_3229 [Desulfonema ishimotonii]|uniref:AdoMet activation domain-containing protein n=1 Tax=Desulfonema ishimotonii TaxID=45657 RepID=A0A401FZ76_9BACT|nr:hypothetical protein [Desulfonema ishimotonii]GBC62260.1 hypothetical protein DENIS_3229 [Desulfonema ishimotonii]
MEILKNIPIELTPREVMASLSQGKRDPSWMIEPAEKAVEMARDLWEPLIIYDWLRVDGVDGENVNVASDNPGHSVSLHMGPHAGLTEKAEMALVSINSIGEKLDEKVRELNQSGETLLGYLLDSVGVMALSKVGDAASALAEKEAEERGWGVGARLSPGSLVGWPVEGQHQLCGLLPMEKAGLELNSGGIIIPFKSASGFIGMGPEYKSAKVGSVCKFCMHKETCWRRKKNHGEQ